MTCFPVVACSFLFCIVDHCSFVKSKVDLLVFNTYIYIYTHTSAIAVPDAVFDLKQLQRCTRASLLFLGSSQKRNIKQHLIKVLLLQTLG